MNNKTKILIVDDHPAIRKTMVDVLTEEGFETDVAKDGSDALSKLLSQLYDFVLIDVQMPKINGVEVLRELKQKKDSLPKFIFFSDCHRGDNSYADDFANNSNIYY